MSITPTPTYLRITLIFADAKQNGLLRNLLVENAQPKYAELNQLKEHS